MQRLIAILCLFLILAACAQSAKGATSATAAPSSAEVRSAGQGTPAAPIQTAPAPEATPPGEPVGSLSAGCATGPNAVVTRQDGEAFLLNLEVARTSAERQRGLMERTELDDNRGMIFVYDAPTRLVFWMKDTLLPLSIAFLATDGEIVDIQDMAPLDTTFHYSAQPAQYAVEVNQGYFDRRGVRVGDWLDLRLDSIGDCTALGESKG